MASVMATDFGRVSPKNIDQRSVGRLVEHIEQKWIHKPFPNTYTPLRVVRCYTFRYFNVNNLIASSL